MPPVTPSDVLTAMITPAVLISAAGLLSLSTSNRLARVVDRTRLLVREFESLSNSPSSEREAARQRLVLCQLDALTTRARLVRGALTSLYLSLSLFILTSLLLAVAVVVHTVSWIPLLLSLAGGICLLVSSVLLIAEGRVSVRSLSEEIAFIEEIARTRKGAADSLSDR
ncbi:MAG TPA: DUF2721 domain-containing protein [Vicinamibacterales bacterium]|nr:DUF2721 domain-containing protein [Vicinamibacterales bacterium]